MTDFLDDRIDPLPCPRRVTHELLDRGARINDTLLKKAAEMRARLADLPDSDELDASEKGRDAQ